MKTLNNSTHIGIISILASLILLPGCDYFDRDSDNKKTPDTIATAEENSEESSSNTIIASKDGKPFLTQENVDAYIDQLEKAQQGAKDYFRQDPSAEKMLIETLINNKIISEHWIKDEGIFDTPEYQRELKQFINMCTMQLAQHNFEQSIAKKFLPTDDEAKKYYNDHKEEIIKEKGGMQAQEVTFSDEKAAIEFLKNAKAPGASFEKLAKEAGKEIIDLGIITTDSRNVDDKIKERILKIAKAPAFDMIKVDDLFHVINSTKKIEPDYYTFEETQDEIKKMLVQEKMPQIISEKQEELRKKYNITVNEDFFKSREEDSMNQMLAALAQQTGMDIDELKNNIMLANDDNQEGEMNFPQSA